MKSAFTLLFLFLHLLMSQNTYAQTPKEFAEAWDKTHISNKFPSNVRHNDLETYLERLRKLGLRVEEVGRSYQEREIYQIEWGEGKTRVFLWAQMHGDEPTATSALMDMFAFLETNKKSKWVRDLEKTLTIRAIPMLNPDGSEVFQRRNIQGIDINRDARSLETPEAQLLMRLRNQFNPEIGFNLHNQQELTSVGTTTSQASISVLAVRANPETEISEGQKRNARICSLIIAALNQFIPGNIARYDDEYTETAFGDTFSDLGTPVILIETGGLHEKDEMYLIKMNFVAIMTALQSLVDGSEAKADLSLYENLPENNGGRIFNYIFRNAAVINFKEIKPEKTELPKPEGAEIKTLTKAGELSKPETVVEIIEADIGVNRDRRRAEIEYPPVFVRRIDKLSGYRGLTEIDVSGFYVFAENGPIRNGRRGAFLFFKRSRKIDWLAKDFSQRFKPDAIFSRGRWIKGGELFAK